MDSFEWFGGIGSQQFDSLKPPGDIYRETFDTARMGMESRGGGGGGGGGSQKDRDDTFEGIKEQWRYKNQQGRRNYYWMMDGVDIKKRNEETLLQHKEYTNKLGYLYKVRATRAQNDAARASWELGGMLQDEQFALNKKAAENAARDVNIWKEEADYKLWLKRQKTDINAHMSKLMLDDKRGGAVDKDVGSFIKYLQNKGKAKTGQQGRTQVKAINDVIAEYGREQTTLARQVNNLESDYNLKAMGFKLERLGHSREELSIKQAYASKFKQIEAQWAGADLKTRASVSSLAPTYQPMPGIPQALPRSEFQYPLNWEDIPEPRSGMHFDGGTSGGQVGAAGGWGGAIGTLGSAMVGAASLPGFTATVGGTSVASTLGGATGFGFLGPVGFGLMATAAIGSAAGWW